MSLFILHLGRMKYRPSYFLKNKIKLFDIKIYYFGDINQRQLYFLSLHWNVTTSLFLISNQELNKNKNKFLYQNRIGKILRY